MSRIEDLIDRELALGADSMQEAMQLPFSAGNTQLRPLFTVLAAQLGPESDAWQVTAVGAALELIHQATLCHYNVTEEVGLDRDANRWNTNLAILTGDYRYATASRLGSRLGPEAFGVIAETFAEVVSGQMRQTRGATTHVAPTEHYLRVARERTGSLLAACGQLGALCAGAPDGEIRGMSRLGRLVGVVVHISDDIAAHGAGASLDLPADATEMAESYAARVREELAELPDNELRQAFSMLVASAHPGGGSDQLSR